jgi:hypothetical protein
MGHKKGRDRELDDIAGLLEDQGFAGSKQFRRLNRLGVLQRQADLLRSDRMSRPHDRAAEGGVGVVHQVDRVARLGLPTIGLDQARPVDGQRRLPSGQPVDGVHEQIAQIVGAATPEAGFDVLGEVDQPRGAAIASDHGRKPLGPATRIHGLGRRGGILCDVIGGPSAMIGMRQLEPPPAFPRRSKTARRS